MKIAVVNSGTLPSPAVCGGAVESLIDFYIDYNESNLDHQITVFSCDHKKLKDIDYSQYKKTKYNIIPTLSLEYRIKRYFFKFKNKIKYYNHYIDYFIYYICSNYIKDQFDIIIVENRPGFILPISSKTKTPIILHSHNDTLFLNKEKDYKIIDCCSCVFTVSQFVTNKILEINNSNPKKIKTLYNGIDLNKFNPQIINDILNRTQLNLKETDFVVVFTGRIDPIKGIKELLYAFHLLKDKSNIKLLIVGSSNFEGAVENQFILEMKQLSKPIAEKVIFTGFIPYSQIPNILSLADIAIVPSMWEDPLTMVSLEAMAMGLPLIVTRSGGIPEAVNEQCAFILNRDENLIQNIKETIMRLYNDSSKRDMMSKAGIQRAKQFSKEIYAEKFYYLIENILH